MLIAKAITPPRAKNTPTAVAGVAFLSPTKLGDATTKVPRETTPRTSCTHKPKLPPTFREEEARLTASGREELTSGLLSISFLQLQIRRYALILDELWKCPQQKRDENWLGNKID
jgi:hypothetical protein